MTNSTSILDGVDAVFDRWLAIPSKGKPPYYSYRSADRALSSQPSIVSDPLTVLLRGLLYLFTRRHLVALGYDSTQELLHAHTIHLRMLAPTAFYAGVNLT